MRPKRAATRGKVTVRVEGETVRRRRTDRLCARLTFDGQVVAEASGRLGEPLELPVARPRLWWTNGLGEQPIYELIVNLMRGDALLDVRTQRIGLCEVRLDRHADAWGESFQFLVNGRPVFAKGANWIPAHSFVNEGRQHFNDLLDSAAAAHMNMLRVWGGCATALS